MKLYELKDKKTKQSIKLIKESGAQIVKVYKLSTGCDVVYSRTNGEEHVSISSKERFPTIDEMEFVRNKLMKEDILIKLLMPRPSHHSGGTSYIGHIMEDTNIMRCN